MQLPDANKHITLYWECNYSFPSSNFHACKQFEWHVIICFPLTTVPEPLC